VPDTVFADDVTATKRISRPSGQTHNSGGPQAWRFHHHDCISQRQRQLRKNSPVDIGYMINYALTATEARSLGLSVKVGMPLEVMEFMKLYPQRRV
jgi:Serine dehydrogenase proteinase